MDPAVLGLRVAAILPALARLAVDGLAPTGHPVGTVLALYAGGFLLVAVFSRRYRPRPWRSRGVGLSAREPMPGRGGR
ncbi:hypothetical protein ACFWIQ_28655 [Kitasatospora sp. NPDC127059]|uniref:hypothetical protein n=1 Tax=unclassified Kitasatospora TaxID=2633591 RepID=UPI003650ABA2